MPKFTAAGHPEGHGKRYHHAGELVVTMNLPADAQGNRVKIRTPIGLWNGELRLDLVQSHTREIRVMSDVGFQHSGTGRVHPRAALSDPSPRHVSSAGVVVDVSARSEERRVGKGC